MLKPREELEKKLISQFFTISRDEKQSQYLELEEQYNIPIDMSADIFNSIKDLSGYNEFILYAITATVKPKLVSTYFTSREITAYSKQKLANTKIKFPIKLKMFEVTTDQWIGVTDAQFLMKLRDAQYINYNADTQRALEIMLNGGKEIARPSVEYKAVNEIANSYGDGSFIPNTISLNINQDDEAADFEFEDDVLTIKNITAFDIFDGYHRYLGMSRNYDKDKRFNYPTELRITNFSVSKAKQFIWQEDHKTKMKKISADTYDQRNPGNILIDRLNTDSTCNLYNQIDLKGGLVNAGELSMIVNKMYFGNKQRVERKDIITAAKTLKQKLNDFTEENEQYLGRKWKKFETLIIIYGLHEDCDFEKILEIIANISKGDKAVLNSAQNIHKKELDIMRGGDM